MEILPFTLDEGIGWKANLGLIVLQSDETLEMEARQFLNQDGVAVYHSRIPCEAQVTADTLSGMQHDLVTAASLLPPAIDFDVIGYGCTSASAVLGEETITRLVQQSHPHTQVTNPATAAIRELQALNAQKIALLTPYIEDVSATLRETLSNAGLEVVSLASFNEMSDNRVARISEQSIHEAIIASSRMADCDAVFVSCTNLRVANVIARSEAELGIPVISSNQALAWDMLRLARLEHISGADDV